jgi:hypothetical protein
VAGTTGVLLERPECGNDQKSQNDIKTEKARTAEMAVVVAASIY